jgi:hypothetical protein
MAVKPRGIPTPARHAAEQFLQTVHDIHDTERTAALLVNLRDIQDIQDIDMSYTADVSTKLDFDAEDPAITRTPSYSEEEMLLPCSLCTHICAGYTELKEHTQKHLKERDSSASSSQAAPGSDKTSPKKKTKSSGKSKTLLIFCKNCENHCYATPNQKIFFEGMDKLKKKLPRLCKSEDLVYHHNPEEYAICGIPGHSRWGTCPWLLKKNGKHNQRHNQMHHPEIYQAHEKILRECSKKAQQKKSESAAAPLVMASPQAFTTGSTYPMASFYARVPHHYQQAFNDAVSARVTELMSLQG